METVSGYRLPLPVLVLLDASNVFWIRSIAVEQRIVGKDAIAADRVNITAGFGPIARHLLDGVVPRRRVPRREHGPLVDRRILYALQARERVVSGVGQPDGFAVAGLAEDVVDGLPASPV